MTDSTASGEFRRHKLDRVTARARSAAPYRWFVLGYTEIQCTHLHLCLSGRRSPRLELAIAETTPRIELEQGRLWCRLTVHTAPDRSVRIGGLSRQRAETIHQALTAARSAATAARRKAREMGPRLIQLAEEAGRTFDGRRYVRHSSALPLRRKVESAVSVCGSALVRYQLDSRSAAALRILEDVETSRRSANAKYVAGARWNVEEASDGVTSHKPTQEQAAAIATDEDVTLVLAGAGAGKTAVIIGKVAHLVRNRKVPPSEILVLAFNKKAAKEVRDRLESAVPTPTRRGAPALANAEVRTFHSFGHRVIAEAAVAPTLSRFAGDDQRLSQAITNWLQGLPNLLLSFIAYHSNVYRSPFSFTTTAEYADHVRSYELRTLSGDRVKSQEEVQVANFLSLHGVHFEYEANYNVQTASRRYRQYQPDFYLPDHDLYIEHFALDENGRAPRHFRDYEAGVAWKRGMHEQNGTRLIETYSWQCRHGVLEERLGQALNREGVELRRVPPEYLLRALDRKVVSSFGNRLATFLQHVRGGGLTPDELERRAAKTRRPSRNRLFLKIFESIRTRYESALEEEGAIDFNDQIIRASELIESERWTSPYRYVLVDEFQDISAGRMRLLKALRRTGTAFFLVGDDWQSIYRFAGSDVSLFRNCGPHLGHVQECNLSATFRYGRGILEPTAKFIQQNPVQTQRPLETRSNAQNGGIILVPTPPQRQQDGVVQALRDIEILSDSETSAIRGGRQWSTLPAPPEDRAKRNRNAAPSVLVLGRYNQSRNTVPRVPKVEFSTVHRAKGREADYGIVLDLNSGGFPSRKEDDPVMEMVLPEANDELPHGEERRLFYVAATRAKRATYLVVDAERPSPFVRELLQLEPNLRKLGAFADDHAPSCPCCDGSLVPSRSGVNLRCTNYPFCSHLAPRCPTCSKGYLLRDNGNAACTETRCGQRAPLCPSCGTGVLMIRNGRYGQFWGCSRYTSVPPCEATYNVR